MKLAILGAGNIAGTMASTASAMPEVELYAVASRDLNRAQAFAGTYQFQKAYGSYEEMVQDPEIDLVYVATPHSHHYEHVKLCLEHGRNVLCEKAFTVNASQAEELLQLAKSKGLLLTEAIWPRYMPSRQLLQDLLSSGIIGEARALTANLCYVLNHVPRNMYPELAGGALLDLGIYTLTFACMTFPSEIRSVVSSAVMNEYGVDDQHSIILTFEDGKTATLHANQTVSSERGGCIYGDQGYILVDNVNNPQGFRVFNRNYELIREVPIPPQISGYEYELESCIRALKQGDLECPEMPHAETLRIMKLMDTIRAQWGMKYPME